MWGKWKRLLWQWRSVLITTPSVAGVVILLRLAGLMQPWEWAAFDQYMRLRPQEPPDERIVIVGINLADIKKIRQPIISDDVYAKLLQKLKARKPRAIGLDIYRDLPVEPGHQELVKVFASTPNLIGIQRVVGDNQREPIDPPPVLKKKGQVGTNDLILDADKKVRRGLLYLTDKNGKTVYSFALYLALLYLDAEGITPETVGQTKNWQLGKTKFIPFAANDGGYVRSDDRGYQILINYRGAAKHFSTVSMTDILEDKIPPEWGRDRIILIGNVSESFEDLFFTPHSSDLLTSPEPMAGVEIHANIASQIISAAKEGRPLIKSWSQPMEMGWILLWSFVGASLTWQWRYAGGVRFLSFQRITSPILAAGVLLASTYAAFLISWWIPVIPPLLTLLGSAIAITAHIARTAGEIRYTFGRYLSKEVVTTLLESPQGLKLGGERRKITILVSDLRGFTSISEQLPPEKVVQILNFYLASMADIITQYQGTIDEFTGDGILVLFGAPTAREDDTTRASACAIAMQLAMTNVNEKMKQWNLPPLEMGIAINTGEVVVGNIGSHIRTKYGVVGSQVNLTYRIESYTIGGQIFISESTFTEVGSIVRVCGQQEVQPKGIKQPINIYEISGISGQYNLFLTPEEEIFLPLAEEIPIEYAILDEKHIDETLFKGSLVKLSTKGALVRPNDLEEDIIPSLLSNIKLTMSSNSPKKLSVDIYAKVLEKSVQKGTFYIYFTTKNSDIEAIFSELSQAIKVAV
ncbi:adenylate/guanylate cyclase domain-containing protein [Desmonostoc muscorum CCALA 125]|nr:adenylate/guanylate cyclase domain-containing protein [Desmonostoc muscorum CCALA 125]